MLASPWQGQQCSLWHSLPCKGTHSPAPCRAVPCRSQCGGTAALGPYHKGRLQPRSNQSLSCHGSSAARTPGPAWPPQALPSARSCQDPEPQGCNPSLAPCRPQRGPMSYSLGVGALPPSTALTPSSRHRGAAEAGEVPAGLHTLPAPGAPPLRQRLQLPRLAQVLPPRVPAPLHPPSRRYGTVAQPPAPPLSQGSRCPCPHPCAIPIAMEQLSLHCWQPPAAAPKAGMGHVEGSGMGHIEGVQQGAGGEVQPAWISRHYPGTPLVQPHVSALCCSALQRNPAPAQQRPLRGSFTPAPSPAWRTRTAWERRSAACWAAALPAWSRCRVRPPQGPLCAIDICHLPTATSSRSTTHHFPYTSSSWCLPMNPSTGTQPLGVHGPWRGAREPQDEQGGRSGMLKPHACSAPSDQPKPRECPAAQPGPCRERCRGDSDCPDAQKCCNSSCGHQCMLAAPAGETGWDKQRGQGCGSGQGVMLWGHGGPRRDLWHNGGPLSLVSLVWALLGPAGELLPVPDLLLLSPMHCLDICPGGHSARSCSATGALPTIREGPGWGPTAWLPGGHWGGEGTSTPTGEATIPLSPSPCRHRWPGPAPWHRGHQPCPSHPAAAPPAEMPSGSGLFPVRGVLSPAVQPGVPRTRPR